MSGLVLDFLKQLLGVSDVFMPENLDLRPRETRAVDDARMVQLIGDDEILFAENRGNRSRIGGEAALEDDASFDIFEACNLLFQVHVDLHLSGDGTHSS